MKKAIILFLAAASVMACKQNPKTSETAGETAKAGDSAVNYTVDAAASTLTWTASKISATHTGTIAITEGTISVEGGNITAGNFTADMKSVTATDIKDETYKAKFLGHIKSADFFMVDSFPTATFEIATVTAEAGADGNTHKISGNLTIKGVSRKVEFPAKVAVTADNLTATALLKLNRNEWGIVWGGKEDKNLMNNMKDDVISNMFDLAVNLTAKK